MASVTTNESTRNEHNKSKSKLKMPKIFNAIVSKITPSKLAVDAVSVNRNRSLTPSMESWQSLPSDEIESTSLPGDRQIMTRTPEPVVPIFNHLSSHTGHSTNNNSVAVTNIGVQHNLTFSQINGLHVGNVNVVHASSTKNGISNGATENIATMTKIEKTRTIKGERRIFHSWINCLMIEFPCRTNGMYGVIVGRAWTWKDARFVTAHGCKLAIHIAWAGLQWGWNRSEMQHSSQSHRRRIRNRLSIVTGMESQTRRSHSWSIVHVPVEQRTEGMRDWTEESGQTQAIAKFIGIVGHRSRWWQVMIRNKILMFKSLLRIGFFKVKLNKLLE